MSCTGVVEEIKPEESLLECHDLLIVKESSFPYVLLQGVVSRTLRSREIEIHETVGGGALIHGIILRTLTRDIALKDDPC